MKRDKKYDTELSHLHKVRFSREAMRIFNYPSTAGLKTPKSTHATTKHSLYFENPHCLRLTL